MDYVLVQTSIDHMHWKILLGNHSITKGTIYWTHGTFLALFRSSL